MIAEFTLGLMVSFAIGVLVGAWSQYRAGLEGVMPAVWRYRRRKMP